MKTEPRPQGSVTRIAKLGSVEALPRGRGSEVA